MTFNQKLTEVFQIGTSENFFLAFLVLLPFLPSLFAMCAFKSIKYQWTLFVLQGVLVLILLSFLGSPESMHDCDRKGITPIAFFMPFLFLFNLIFVVALGLIKLIRRRVN